MVGTVKTLGSDFISSVNALSKKVKEPIPYVCNALLKANLTSHVSKDGRFPPLCVLLCYLDGALYRCTLLLESHVNALSAKQLRPDLVAGEKLMARARELVDTTDGPMDGGSRT